MEMIKTEAMRIPAAFWLSLAGSEPGAITQATRLCTLPFAVAAAFMPDMHRGYGFPIGTVLATDGVIVPYGVGNDIGCGMVAYRTTVHADDLRRPHDKHGTVLKGVLGRLMRDVPAGEGPRGQHKEPREARLLEEMPAMPVVPRDDVASADIGQLHDRLVSAAGRAAYQIGSLGSGNHFLEVQVDEEGLVWVMIHSGSRGLGGAVCTYFDALAASLAVARNWYVPPRDPAAGASRADGRNDLAHLPVDSEEGEQYVEWMQFCLRYAEENRTVMVWKALSAIFDAVPGEVTVQVHTHHNLATRERHFDREVWVHRKGAVHAPHGELVCIPGSMTTGSYIARGKGDARAMRSCSHGAGRKLSRTAAAKAMTKDQVLDTLTRAGVEIVMPNFALVAQEGGHAYKAIEDVMADQTDLVEPVHRLTPIGVYKG